MEHFCSKLLVTQHIRKRFLPFVWPFEVTYIVKRPVPVMVIDPDRFFLITRKIPSFSARFTKGFDSIEEIDNFAKDMKKGWCETCGNVDNCYYFKI